jgi:hypothetical protein
MSEGEIKVGSLVVRTAKGFDKMCRYRRRGRPRPDEVGVVYEIIRWEDAEPSVRVRFPSDPENIVWLSDIKLAPDDPALGA